MALRVAIGRRVFAPTWLMTCATLVLLLAFVSLGRWQWGRALEKRALWDAFAQAADAPQPVGSAAPDLTALPRFARIALRGSYDPSRQFLLDNRSHGGRAGYEALTPLVLAGGRAVLIDRGWLPFEGFRGRPPSVGFTPPAAVTVTGRVDELPSSGLARGHAAPPPGSGWPKVTSFPAHEELERALGVPLERRIVLLDPQAPFGYTRQWQPPGVSPDRHLSYAIQWWLFALLLLVLYGYLNLRKAQ